MFRNAIRYRLVLKYFGFLSRGRLRRRPGCKAQTRQSSERTEPWPSQRFSRFLAIFEVGILYSATFNLESATAQGVRLIRTAQVQNQNFDAGKFKTEVCKRITAPITCAGLLEFRRRWLRPHQIRSTTTAISRPILPTTRASGGRRGGQGLLPMAARGRAAQAYQPRQHAERRQAPGGDYRLPQRTFPAAAVTRWDVWHRSSE